MRVLLSFAGGRGHALPMLPLATALRAAGHTVAFSGRASVVGELAGFEALPDPPGPLDVRTGVIDPLAPFDPEREDRLLRDGFAGSIARERAARVAALCREWRPDVVVCEE